MFRWLARSAVAVLILLVIVVATLPWLAGPALRVALQATGFEEVRFDSLRLGLNRLELSNLRLGPPPEQRIVRLQARWRLEDLLAGRVASLEINGLRLHGRLSERGLALNGRPVRDTGDGGLLPALPWPERLVIEDAALELATPVGRLHLPLEARLEPRGARAGFRLVSEPLTLQGPDGTVGGRLELEGSLPTNEAPRLSTIEARGRVHLAADRSAREDAARTADASGSIALSVEDGSATVSTSDLELQVNASPGPLATAARELLPAPWHVRAGSKEDPLRLALSERADGYALEFTGTTHLAAADASVQAAARGSLVLGGDFALREVDLETLSLSSEGLQWRDLEVRSAALELEASGSPEDLQGRAHLRLEGAGSISDLTLRGLMLEQPFEFTRTPRRLVLTLRSGGAVRVDELAWRDQLQAGPVSVTPRRSDEAALVIQAEDGRLRGWQQTLSADIEAARLQLERTGSPIELEDAGARLQLRLSGDGGGFEEGRLLIEDGAIRVPAQNVSLDGIRSDLALAASGLAADVPVDVATIRHGGQPPWFSPLRLQVSLRPRPEAIGFQGRLRGAGGALSLSVRGSHQLAQGHGRMVVEGAPIRFAPGELQPADLVPALGAALERVSGQLDLDGELVWQDAGLQSDLAVLLDDVGFTAGPARLREVDGLVRFDRLEPLATPPGQRLSAGRLDVGLPLSHGFATFQLEPGGPLSVDQLRFRFAGGTLRAEPFSVGSAPSAINVTLVAERLSLAQILEQLEIDGLTGEGTIGGRLPVAIEGDEALIRGGELVSERPGRLRYRPDETPAALQADAEGLDLLLQALENFRYEELRITLNGRTDAGMDVQLHIEGANPDLYGGHPIEFNLNLEGELGNILRSSLRGYQVPERIQRQLRGRQQQ